jgi:hypothetical protein
MKAAFDLDPSWRVVAMVDSIGVAGLAIAVSSQLLKLGEKASQVVQDAKSFKVVRRVTLVILHVASTPLTA